MRRYLVALIAIAGFTSPLFSQQPFDVSPHGAEAVTRLSSHQLLLPQAFELFVPYWTIEAGWRSELQLRNNSNENLTVTPVLRTMTGAENPLASVSINPQEVKSIEITAAASQLASAFGSAVLRYSSPFSRALYAAVMVRAIGHSIAFHLDAIAEAKDFEDATREGVWWLPNEGASDYLVLTNQSSAPMKLDLSLFDAHGKESKRNINLGPRQTTRYSVRQLARSAGLAGSFGGIRVAARTHAGSLDTVHFLFDEQAGFSALLKMFDHDPRATVVERDFARTGQWATRAPMLALTRPDPALAFPENVILHPQVFIRNTMGKPANVSLSFGWRSGTATGKAAGPALRLAPFETRRLDVAALQDGKILPKEASWTSIKLITDTRPDEVVAVAASYDATLRYGAQTPFSDQLSFKWKGGMWEYDPEHDSIISAGNGGTKPVRTAFTIFHNRGVDKYELEQTLQPDQQMWIDVGKLIRDRIPDKNGRTLPADLTMGSYEFRDLTDVGIGSLFEGKVIYDRTYGSATYGCANCCGYYSPFLSFNPLGIVYTGGSQNGVEANDDCGDFGVNLNYYFTNGWTTASHPIAIVDTYGHHTGMGVGSTTTNATGYITVYAPRSCPVGQRTANGGDNVTPKVSIGSQGYVYIGQDPTVPPANYLIASPNPSGGTYLWSSTDISISFDNSQASTVHVTAKTYSGGTNDTPISVKYTYNSQVVNASVNVTKRIFKYLAGDSVITLVVYNGPNTYGYVYQASYNVFTNPGGQQVANAGGISTYENVTVVSHNVSFSPNFGQGALSSNSQVVDNPIGLTSNSKLPSNLSIVDSQDIGVGGIYVRTNTLTFTASGLTVTNDGPYN